jgi:hypothetical protein
MPNVDEDSIEFVKLNGSLPDGAVQRGDDIDEETKETFADFLHCLSRDGRDGNTFTIKPNVQETSLRGDDGEPAALDENARGSENPFAPANENPQIRRYSDSAQVFQPSVEAFLGTGEERHNALKDIEGNTNNAGQTNPENNITDPKIISVISALQRNNRFAPGPGDGEAFINNGTAPATLVPSQQDFGSHDSNGTDVTYDDLRKVGFSSMLRAAREIKAVQDGDPESGIVGLGALIPGGAQIAVVRVDTNELRARQILEDFGLPPKPRSDSEPVVIPNNKSWGHLNHPLEKYDGFLPLGMTALSFVLVIALRLVTQALLALLGLIAKPNDLDEVPNRGPFIAGEYGRADPPGRLFSLRAIGIEKIDRPFLDAVDAGLDVFFGLGFDAGGFDASAARLVVQNPQFYVIFSRAIIRSGNTVIREIQDAFSQGGFVQGAQAVLGLIDVLRSSKIIAFLNVLAQLGDRALALREQGFIPGQARRVSSVEFLPDNPATRVMKIRQGRSDLKGTMRTSVLPSKFVFPEEVLKGGNLLNGYGGADLSKTIAGLPSDNVAGPDELDANNRIPQEMVEEMEKQLDSEYVPFYFQDLRTNEIIAFHAFLENLEDAYVPQYENTLAYGRIDQVRTYAATERSINLSFRILATSKDDFDVMWWKINKLTSLVYPSFTQGRQVEFDGTKFIQPFSQVPASTPVIRMRIGDMIRSNYSRFALARIFGVGSDENTQFDDAENNVKTEGIPANIAEIRGKRDRMLRNPAATLNSTDGYFTGETALLLPKRAGYNEAGDQFAGGAGAAVAAIFNDNTSKKLVVTAATRVRIAGSSIINIPGFGGTSPGASTKGYGEHRVAYYKVEVEGATSDELRGTFIVTHDDLVPDPEMFAEALFFEQTPINIDLPIQIPNSNPPNPFDPAENVIVRSFNKVKGKGLGGVITNLTYSELAGAQTTWETSEFGSRAPKMILVTMTFAAMHDIAPGLDNTGFMRAIQYPVGNAARFAQGSGGEQEEKEAERLFNENHQAASRFLQNPGAPKEG